MLTTTNDHQRPVLDRHRCLLLSHKASKGKPFGPFQPSPLALVLLVL